MTSQLQDFRVLRGAAPLTDAPSPPASVTTLPALFQYQARLQPDKIAFSFQETDEEEGLKAVTYAEADAIAASVAIQISQIHSLPHIAREDAAPVVAVWLEKGLDLILSILATTYSGATWLPLDPDVPVERVTICVKDASATAVICDAAHLDRAREVQRLVSEADTGVTLGGGPLQVRTYEQLVKQSNAIAPPHIYPSNPQPHHAAYIIYTSGTTGTPKGIAIPHSAALIFSLSEREVLQTSPSDIVWNGFSPAFDMFVEEMWVTIAGGGHLTIGSRAECRDVPGLPAIWKARGVTVVNAVPTLISIMGISQVGDEGSPLLPACIRLINLGGEACPPALVKRLARDGLRIVNTYGPTETTVTATWEECRPNVPVTIGRPLPSYHACLLPISEDGIVSLQPLELSEGVEGELAIGGPCVGLGYVGRPNLTAQKFIPHPLAPESGERLYRTGDRVKLQADLKIVFLGRIDTQVKHRGFRIELGEIENLISSHPDVQTSAVILANADSENARLEGFVVLRSGAESDVASIKQLCSSRLPAYMVPDELYFLDAEEMPRLPSGKINGKALHEVSQRKAAEAAVNISDLSLMLPKEHEIDSPLGMLLAAMATVFPQAGRINPEADFFDDLGGHSLTAAILVSRLRQARNAIDGSLPFASMGLPDIYEGRTPANIASRYTFSGNHENAFDSLNEEDATGPSTGEHLPVSQTKFVLCGIAQLIPLLFLFFVYSLEILVPYLFFDFLVRIDHVGWALFGAYGVFVTIPPLLSLIAITGKWIILGKAKEGEYPLYGVYYFRWWTAERLAALANPKLVAESALYPFFLRAMGARIGSFCHMGSLAIGACCDLVEIGNDVVIGSDVVLAVSVVERGRLVLKKVVIHDNAIIGSNCVVEGGAIIEEGAEVAALSLIPDGMTIPTYQRHHGSPAQFESKVAEDMGALGPKTRPSTARSTAMALGNIYISGLVLPLLYLVPQIPGLLLFEAIHLRSISGWGQVGILAIPIALAYQIIVFLQLLSFRHAFLGPLKEGTFSIYSSWYLRKWFIDRLMDLALEILHPVFATLYIVPFLRALGIKIGHRAEISTARGLPFELLSIGEESFVADSVKLGDAEIRGNHLTLKKTILEARAFAGNASVIPQGTTLASGTLVGVLSIAPSKPLEKNTSCFGSPPVLMPARHHATGHAESLLFNPSKLRIAARLTIEGIRIVLPRAIIIFSLGFSLQIAYTLYTTIGVIHTLLLLPLFYLIMFALPSLLLIIILKWTLIGRYKPAEWPLWSLNVWISEAVTSTYETLTEPLLANLLVGTPYLAMLFRSLGVRIGSRVTLLASDITEYDCVTIGDEAMIGERCGAQTHLFEDRVMKIGKVVFGKRACAKAYSVCLPGSEVGEGAQLGGLSCVMKGERLPEGTAWEGAPVRPRGRRRRRGIEGGRGEKGGGGSAVATTAVTVIGSECSIEGKRGGGSLSDADTVKSR